MRPIELVIFDCDGVLVDSEPVANRVFAAHLGREGLDWGAEETQRRLMGRSLASCMTIVEQELGRRLPDDFLDRLEVATFEAFRAELEPVAGIEQAIASVAPRPTCVASSGSHRKMRFTLGLTGLLSHFEGRLFSASQVERGKPAPDLFLYVARELGFEPDRCVVIEDSLPGVEAARAAGMRVIGYAGRSDGRALADAGARPITCMARLSESLEAEESEE